MNFKCSGKFSKTNPYVMLENNPQQIPKAWNHVKFTCDDGKVKLETNSKKN